MANQGKRTPAKRAITKIILHCSATPEGADIGINTIRQWHLARGWKDVGYHYVIRLNGVVQTGRPETQTGAHTQGQNASSIGICYIGGTDARNKPKDTMTAAQEHSFMQLVKDLRAKYGALSVHGHNEYANKACPSFVVKTKWPNLNQPQ